MSVESTEYILLVIKVNLRLTIWLRAS